MGKPTHVSEIKERLFRETPYQRVRIDGVENGIALVDNHGYAMELQEMKELIEGLSATIAHIERTGDNFLEREECRAAYFRSVRRRSTLWQGSILLPQTVSRRFKAPLVFCL